MVKITPYEKVRDIEQCTNIELYTQSVQEKKKNEENHLHAQIIPLKLEKLRKTLHAQLALIEWYSVTCNRPSDGHKMKNLSYRRRRAVANEVL